MSIDIEQFKFKLMVSTSQTQVSSENAWFEFKLDLHRKIEINA